MVNGEYLGHTIESGFRWRYRDGFRESHNIVSEKVS